LKIVNSIHSIINRITIRHSCESRNPEKYWIPPYQVRGGLSQARNDKAGNPMSPSSSREEGWVGAKGFTLIEIIIVIVILSIVGVMTVKFLTDSLSIYAMTINQKALYDEGNLALERMCRDIRDAKSITTFAAGPPGSITFVRTNATAYDDGLPGYATGETIIFQQNQAAGTLEKVKSRPSASTTTMAEHVTSFTVTNATNEILLQLTLQSIYAGNTMTVTLQTRVYPKNLPKDAIYKNFCQNWKEAYQ
jgi:prepilin-type N-terminal cleavage/methylation domain-containing protein